MVALSGSRDKKCSPREKDPLTLGGAFDKKIALRRAVRPKSWYPMV